MTKFDACVQFVFDREGREFEDNPADPGGQTKFGISKKSYPNVDIPNLTEAQAKEIAYRDYWQPFNCDQYEPRLALAVFDTAFNQGVGVARQILVELGTKGTFTAEQFLFRRLRRYANLVQQNPAKFKPWLDTWLLRVIKLTEYIFPLIEAQ